ncbi:hypothetical protein KM043_007676 [Ampulex compressa]|nr:hypothetical protein KM043_007676 [Ampulex compressa]
MLIMIDKCSPEDLKPLTNPRIRESALRFEAAAGGWRISNEPSRGERLDSEAAEPSAPRKATKKSRKRRRAARLTFKKKHGKRHRQFKLMNTVNAEEMDLPPNEKFTCIFCSFQTCRPIVLKYHIVNTHA